MEVFQWIMASLAVGGMLLSAGALGYAAREAAKMAERNREAIGQQERLLTEHSGAISHHREVIQELRSDMRRIEGLLRGENGRRP